MYFCVSFSEIKDVELPIIFDQSDPVDFSCLTNILSQNKLALSREKARAKETAIYILCLWCERDDTKMAVADAIGCSSYFFFLTDFYFEFVKNDSLSLSVNSLTKVGCNLVVFQSIASMIVLNSAD